MEIEITQSRYDTIKEIVEGLKDDENLTELDLNQVIVD